MSDKDQDEQRALDWFRELSDKDKEKAFLELYSFALDAEYVQTWTHDQAMELAEEKGVSTSAYLAPYFRSCGEPLIVESPLVLARRYANGEVITEEGADPTGPVSTSERWYDDYQCMCELACYGNYETLDDLLNDFLEEYKQRHGRSYPDPEQALRWAVFQFECAKQID